MTKEGDGSQKIDLTNPDALTGVLKYKPDLRIQNIHGTEKKEEPKVEEKKEEIKKEEPKKTELKLSEAEKSVLEMKKLNTDLEAALKKNDAKKIKEVQLKILEANKARQAKKISDKDFDDANKRIKDEIEKTAEKAGKILDQKIDNIKTTTDQQFKVLQEKIEGNPARNLINSRTAYAEGYKQFMAERKSKAGLFTRLGHKIFGGEVKKEEIPESLKKLEANYNKMAAEYGQKMYDAKKAELEKSGTSEGAIKAELARFKQNEIFTRVLVEEQSKLNGLKAENLPAKEKAIWKKGLDWYLKQPRWKRIAIATALSTTAFAALAPGAVAAAGGVATYAGVKFARGFAGSVLGQGAAKAYDFLVKEKSGEVRKKLEEELKQNFGKEPFDLSLAKSKKEYAEILEREQKAKRQRLITKALITMAAGGAVAYEMGHLTAENAPEPIIKTQPEPITYPSPDTILHQDTTHAHTEPVEADTTKVSKPKLTWPVPAEPAEAEPAVAPENIFKGESVNFSSRGAIQTIVDLKEKIRQDYPDLSKAPHSVQEFMKETSATKQAAALGLFDPNNPNAESAMLWKGSTIGFDEHGNLSYQDIKTGQTHSLIEEQAGKETIQKYQGKMFDAERGAATSAPEAPEHGDSTYTIQEESFTEEPVQPPLETSPMDTGTAAETHEQAIGEENPAVSPEAEGETDTINQKKPETTSEQAPLSNNPYNLSSTELIKVEKVYDANIEHAFSKNMQSWNMIKDSHDLPAEKMMSMKEGSINETYKPLVSYLHKLHDVTGLNPREASVLQPAPETNAEYIRRALQKAAQMGKLDKVTL